MNGQQNVVCAAPESMGGECAQGLPESAVPQPAEAARLDALRAALCRQPVVVAFSGGLDSRFLAFTARQAGADVLLVHAAGPHVPPQEQAHAQRWAAQQRLPLLLVPYNPLTLDGVRNNSRQRCYACKRELFACVRATLEAHGLGACRLCDGTHAGDLLVWRPGLRALREAGVWSPLAEAGLDKAALRRLARACGMDNPEQRARPCLLTRLAYGLTPDAATLARVAAAEEAVAAALARAGAHADFRLRLTPAPVLQCTPLTAAQRTAALAALTAQGYAHTALREEADISGFFDRQPPPVF